MPISQWEREFKIEEKEICFLIFLNFGHLDCPPPPPPPLAQTSFVNNQALPYHLELIYELAILSS